MDWVTRKNIEPFATLLASEQDPEKIVLLRSLLQAERQKLAQLDVLQTPTSPRRPA